MTTAKHTDFVYCKIVLRTVSRLLAMRLKAQHNEIKGDSRRCTIYRVTLTVEIELSAFRL